MKVIVASSGVSFNVDIRPDQTGEELKQKLAVETSISMKNQILFTSEGIRIRGGNIPLNHSDYQLFSNKKKNSSLLSIDASEKKDTVESIVTTVVVANQDKDKDKDKEIEQACVYLFDREYIRDPTVNNEDIIVIDDYRCNEPTLNDMKASIKKEETSTTTTTIGANTNTTGSVPTSTTTTTAPTTTTTLSVIDLEKHPLSNSPSILVKMLPQFELQFQYHWFVSQFHTNQNQERIQACMRCLQQLRYQQKSLQVLNKHLNSLSDKMNTSLKDYVKQFEKQSSEHELLLQQFESDLEKLGNIQLHPALQTQSKKTLLDCVPERGLREWYSRCKQSHEKLTSKVTELKEEKMRIDDKHRTVTDSITRVPFSFQKLSNEVRSSENKLKDLQQIEKVLLQDLQQVQGTIANAVAELQNANGLSMEVSHSPTRFDQSNDQHVTGLLPKLRAIDNEVLNVLTHFQEAQTVMLNLFADSVSLVADLQKSLMDQNNKLAALSESLSRKQELFDQLIKVKKLPQSYIGCLEEVVRRRAFGQVLSKELNNLSEALNQFREKETNRRLEFLHQHGWNLPSDLVTGLSNKPGVCELRYHNLEESLPAIESFESSNNDDHQMITLADLESQFRESLLELLPKGKEPELNSGLRNKQVILKEKEKENEKLIALARQKEDSENELKKWKSQCEALKKERDDLKYELENYQLPEIPKTIENNTNVEDSVNILEAQLSRMFGGIQDPMVLSRASQYFSRAMNSSGIGNNNNKDSKAASEIVAEMDVMKAELTKLKKENEMLSVRVRKLNHENEILRDERKGLETNIKTLQEEGHIWKVQYDNCMLDYQDKLKELMAVEALRSEETKEYESLRQQAKDYELIVRQMKEFELALPNLNSEINHLRQENIRLRQSETEFQTEKRTLLFTIKELTEENDKIQKELSSVRDDKNQMQETLAWMDKEHLNEQKQMEGTLKSCSNSRIRFDKDFGSGDWILFINVTPSSSQDNKKIRPVYMAFIHDSPFPCLLEDVDSVKEMLPNLPKWIIGEVVNKETVALRVPNYGLKRNDSITQVLAGDFKQIIFDDGIIKSP